jgi:hypothetical protein
MRGSSRMPAHRRVGIVDELRQCSPGPRDGDRHYFDAETKGVIAN